MKLDTCESQVVYLIAIIEPGDVRWPHRFAPTTLTCLWSCAATRGCLRVGLASLGVPGLGSMVSHKLYKI